MPYLKSNDRDKRVQSLSRGVCGGGVEGIRLWSMGRGPGESIVHGPRTSSLRHCPPCQPHRGKRNFQLQFTFSWFLLSTLQEKRYMDRPSQGITYYTLELLDHTHHTLELDHTHHTLELDHVHYPTHQSQHPPSYISCLKHHSQLQFKFSCFIYQSYRGKHIWIGSMKESQTTPCPLPCPSLPLPPLWHHVSNINHKYKFKFSCLHFV